MRNFLLIVFFALFQVACSFNNGVLENYRANTDLSNINIIDCEQALSKNVDLFFTEDQEVGNFIKNMNDKGYYLVAQSIWNGPFENDIAKQALDIAKKNKICLVTYDYQITKTVNTTIPITNYHTDYYGNSYTTTSYMPTTLHGAEHIVLFWKKYSIPQANNPKNDLEQLTKDAESGMKEAQGLLGFLYYNGEDVKQDYQKAKYWLEKSSAQDDEDAHFYLASLYYNGYGVRQNYQTAFKLYEKSAQKGNAHACGMLGLMYKYGKGVRQDLSLAKEWYGKACDNGVQKGCELYKELNEKGIK